MAKNVEYLIDYKVQTSRFFLFSNINRNNKIKVINTTKQKWDGLQKRQNKDAPAAGEEWKIFDEVQTRQSGDAPAVGEECRRFNGLQVFSF